jgi:hypothetical protein
MLNLVVSKEAARLLKVKIRITVKLNPFSEHKYKI